MTDLDQQKQRAAASLTHRLKNRGDGEGQYPADDELFALDFITAMHGQGWRWIEALARPSSGPAVPAGDRGHQAAAALRAEMGWPGTPEREGAPS